eukprot:scaffold2122_cov69-Phaeocystis_antarctica.AAC.6
MRDVDCRLGSQEGYISLRCKPKPVGPPRWPPLYLETPHAKLTAKLTPFSSNPSMESTSARRNSTAVPSPLTSEETNSQRKLRALSTTPRPICPVFTVL